MGSFLNASFTEHNAFEVHLCYSMYPSFVSFIAE